MYLGQILFNLPWVLLFKVQKDSGFPMFSTILLYYLNLTCTA